MKSPLLKRQMLAAVAGIGTYLVLIVGPWPCEPNSECQRIVYNHFVLLLLPSAIFGALVLLPALPKHQRQRWRVAALFAASLVTWSLAFEVPSLYHEGRTVLVPTGAMLFFPAFQCAVLGAAGLALLLPLLYQIREPNQFRGWLLIAGTVGGLLGLIFPVAIVVWNIGVCTALNKALANGA